jgi:16S rRNA (cytidine1402-2'-O)-methyltransferase
MAGTLYLVSTPIGNQEDMTFRAVCILREVQFIAAEDTRITRALLDHYGIDTPLTTYHQLNKEEKTPIILNRLANGHDVALVSDAGTPVIADPGAFLVSNALAAGLRVTSIPGASAITAALALSGIPCTEFVFFGIFPSRSAARRRLAMAMSDEIRTSICFVPASRLQAALDLFRPLLGARRGVIAQDLTTVHETVLRGTLAELHRNARDHPRGTDVTLIVEGGKKKRGKRARTLSAKIRGASE